MPGKGPDNDRVLNMQVFPGDTEEGFINWFTKGSLEVRTVTVVLAMSRLTKRESSQSLSPECHCPAGLRVWRQEAAWRKLIYPHPDYLNLSRKCAFWL